MAMSRAEVRARYAARQRGEDVPAAQHDTRRRDWRERFLEKVDRRADDECWPWLGTLSSTGYGNFRGPRGDTSAHAAAVEYATGERVPKGMTVDHVRAAGCTRKDCVNWLRHLEVVPHGENVKRSKGETCKNGHEWTGTRRNGDRVSRYCHTCAAERTRARRAATRAE